MFNLECKMCLEVQWVWAKPDNCGCNVCLSCMVEWFERERERSCPLCRVGCSSFEREEVEVPECVVCLDAQVPRSTACGHAVCEDCLDRIVQTSSSCPVCRQNLNHWEVERIVDVQETSQGLQLLLQWMDGSLTWEPESNLVECDQLIEDYVRRINQ